MRTSTGEFIRASRAVLASVHPHHLGDLVGGLDAEVAEEASRTRLSPNTAFVLHASLDEPLRFRAGADLDAVVWNTLSSSSLADVHRAFDGLRHGRLPSVPLLEAGCPSMADPSRAPRGNATLHLLSPRHAELTLTEGRYHQVRRMFAACGATVLALHRTQFGDLELGDLAPGQWRELPLDYFP